jgi:RimJ/RimL family protein N-acetyltransferase
MQVRLRDVEPADLPVLFEHQRDPVSIEMATVPAREHESFMTHWQAVLADETIRTQAVIADDRLAGNVVSFVRDGRREVGYWLGREFWGAGVASAALAAFLEGETERPLYAGVVPHNAGSLRVLAKCGFAVCGEEDGRVILRLD